MELKIVLELPVFHNLNTFDSNQQLATNCSSLLFNDRSITKDVSMHLHATYT